MVKAKSPKVIPQAAKKEEEAALKKKKIEEEEDDDELDDEDDEDLDDDDEEDDDDVHAGPPGGAVDDDDDDDDEDEEDEDDEDEEGDDDDDDEDDDEDDEDSPKKADKSPKGKQPNQKGSEKRKNDGAGEDGKAKKLKESEYLSAEERKDRSLRTLFVSGLSDDTAEDEITEFAPESVAVKLIEKPTGRFAFVEFESEAIAEKNFAALQGKQISGKPVKVEYSGEKGRQSEVAQSKTLLLRGIAAETTQGDVIRAFPLSVSANVLSNAPIIAYVDFESHEDAAKQMEEFKDNLVIRGSKVTIEYGRSRPAGGRGGFGGGRGGGFRGGRGEGFRGGRGGDRGGGGFRGGRGGDRGGGGFRGGFRGGDRGGRGGRGGFGGGDRGGRGRGGFGGRGGGNRSFD